jgi:hypothetical protein
MVADTANEAAFAPSITTTRVLKEAAAAVANGTMDSASKRNPSENGRQQNGEISISASGGGGGGGGEQLLVVAAAKKVRDAEGRRRRRKQKKKSKDGTTVATTAAAGKREDSGVDNDSDKEDVAAVEVDSFAGISFCRLPVLGFVNYLWCEVVLNSPVLQNTKHQKLVFVREPIGPSASFFHVQII